MCPLPHTQFQQDTQTSMKTTRGSCNSSKSRFALTFALPNSCISTNSLRLLHCFLYINLLCKSYGMGGSQRSQCFFRSYNEGPAVPAPLPTGVSPTLKTSQHRDSTTSSVNCSSHSQFSLLHVSYCIIWIFLDAICMNYMWFCLPILLPTAPHRDHCVPSVSPFPDHPTADPECCLSPPR